VRLAIITTSEPHYVDSAGQVRTARVPIPSADWRVTGAVEYGRGYTRGLIVRRYSLEDIMCGAVPWFYRNGKQRCYVVDNDHGHTRVWMCPPLRTVDIGG
jgi:hypothetical protein